jgi:hypothetical protein
MTAARSAIAVVAEQRRFFSVSCCAADPVRPTIAENTQAERSSTMPSLLTADWFAA